MISYRFSFLPGRSSLEKWDGNKILQGLNIYKGLIFAFFGCEGKPDDPGPVSVTVEAWAYKAGRDEKTITIR
jgi:hypothetical protein